MPKNPPPTPIALLHRAPYVKESAFWSERLNEERIAFNAAPRKGSLPPMMSFVVEDEMRHEEAQRRREKARRMLQLLSGQPPLVEPTLKLTAASPPPATPATPDEGTKRTATLPRGESERARLARRCKKLEAEIAKERSLMAEVERELRSCAEA